MLKLEINGLGPYRYGKAVETENKFIEILDPTANGKTTIARILYAFLTGHVDTSLLTTGASEGYATLTFNGKTYWLTIKQGLANVNKLLEEPYAEYLVLTEGTPLYSFYVSPPKQIDIDDLVRRFVPQPPELSKLEADLRALESKTFDFDKLIQSYQVTLNEKQKNLASLEEELRKVNEELSKVIDVKKIEPVFEKQKLQDQVKALEAEIKKLQDEYTRLVTEVQMENYDEIKSKYEDLSGKIERLYRTRDRIDKVIGSLEKIRDALDIIRGDVDVLMEYDIVLFGQPPDPDSVESWISDLKAGIETLTAKRTELRAEISKLEQEKNRVEITLEEYAKKLERIRELESTISRRNRELSEAKIRLTSAERYVQMLERELGMSEDEIIKRATESKNADRLMARKRELERQIEETKRLIRDIETAIEKTKQKKEEAIESKSKYEEIKRKYNAIKNEWNEKKRIFRETFKVAFKEVFKNINIPDFDPENMIIFRPPHTYSQGERLLMTIAYQYGIVSALRAVGYDVPMVVIDLIVPIDDRYELEIIRVYKNLDTMRILLKTSNETGIKVIV